MTDKRKMMVMFLVGFFVGMFVCDILNESSIGQQPHMRWLDKHKEQPE